jgi:hypothetical protein
MADNDKNSLGEVEENLSHIETSENLLIQHIRTAGIRKPREIELIDEIMTLRRERRRSFSSVEHAARIFRKENVSLQMQLEKAMKEAASEISLFKSSLSSTLKKKDLEVQSIIDHYDDMFLKEKERQVERKIEELVGAKAKHDHTTAEAIAFDLTAKSISELNEQHQMKLLKYVSKIVISSDSYISLHQYNALTYSHPLATIGTKMRCEQLQSGRRRWLTRF